jgi:hypothetical protein
MVDKKSTTVANSEKGRSRHAARVFAVAGKPITLGPEFAEFMSAIMSDVVLGDISPDICNASCNAGGKLLKYAELCMKYGKGKPFRLLGDQ